VMRHRSVVLGYNDLTVGDEWESPARTVTEADVASFAGLSGDFNPLHGDHAGAAAEGPFGRPVAHGLLGLALASGLASASPRMDTLAFLAVLEWRFLLPIAFGDTVRVLSSVESIEPQARGRRAVVAWRRRLLNQEGRVVQEGLTQSLVRARVVPEPGSPPA
jgi:3-hydroxybutyryl-CoA dehydratase